MYIIWISCLVLAFSVVTGEDCETIDKCSCKTSKGTVNLRGLIKEGSPNPRFTAPDANNSFKYNFEPCQALSQPCGTGGSASICQISTSGDSYIVGTVDSASFSGDPEKDTLVLNYHDSSNYRTAVVNLHCSSTEEGKMGSVKEDPPQHYVFDLQTKYACLPSSHKLSAGSVLLIIVFVLLAVYFIGGVIFLKFVRGAQGTEMVPNFDFWTSLPGYIKDGVQFTCRGCKTQSSYSQI